MLQIQILGDHPLSQGPWPFVKIPPPEMKPFSETKDIESLGLKNDLDVAKISYQSTGLDQSDWQTLDLDIFRLQIDNSGIEDLRAPPYGKFNGQRVVLDFKWFTTDLQFQESSSPEKRVLDRIRQLAALLSKRNSNTQRARLLECAGVYRHPDRQACSYVFKFPDACFGNPVSLQELESKAFKAENPHMPPLEGHVRFALVLAVALPQFHAADGFTNRL